MTDELDRWLSPQVRSEIERYYYAEVNSQARFEKLSRDHAFLESVQRGEPHVGLFSDHGVVHVRDVARQVLSILDCIHGLLIPARPPWRFNLMKGYGVLLAYLHDIGMLDFSAFGRAMHPEFATHSVFNPQLDPIINALWDENSANLAWELIHMKQDGALEQSPKLVLRELLALCMAHSKSKVPTDVLNNPTQLRQTLIEALSTDLHHLYGVQRVKLARQRMIQARQQGDIERAERWQAVLTSAEDALVANQNAPAPASDYSLHRLYPKFPDDAFRWLVSDHPGVQPLIDDTIDTVRALRCADALRQRGTVLKTSGGYEVFVSSQSALAVYSLQSSEGELYVVEIDNPISAGEANVASSELDIEGNLRISFHRGLFATPAATDYAIESAALVVNDIVQDGLSSFRRSAEAIHPRSLKTADETLVLLEETEDSVEFSTRVRKRVEELDPWLRGRVRVVPSLTESSERERVMYLAGKPITWDLTTRLDLLARISRFGHRVEHIDPEFAFQDTRLVSLRAGEVLLEAGAPSAFVYIPMEPGLRIAPLGGYEIVHARPWTPLGVTGVIRGAPRNATIEAESPVRLMMIPKGVYLRNWYCAHTAETFIRAVTERTTATSTTLLSPLEKALLLGQVGLFAEASHEGLLALATQTSEVLVGQEVTIFEKGTPGDSLFVIASGSVRVLDGEQQLDTLGAGEAFGEMAILTPEPRMATVVTETETRLLKLPAAVFARFLTSNGEVASAVAAVLARRLRERSQEIVQMRARLSDDGFAIDSYAP